MVQGLHVVAVAGAFCLPLGCGTEDQPPTAANGGGAGIASTGGSNAGAGIASTGGSNAGAATGGAATGGAATGGGATGGAASSAGTPAGGNGGTVGGGGADQVGGTGNGGSGGTAGTGAGTFSLTSPAFDAITGCSVENPSSCDVFPDENVSYMGNANISPELRWTGAPAGTQSFAMVLLDATFGQAHWVMWNIPANVQMLAANVPQDTAMPATPVGARQTNANFAPEGSDGYFGPHIPCNVFQFELYALSLSTFSPMNSESAGLVYIELQELADPVLATAKLSGRSNNYMMTCE